MITKESLIEFIQNGQEEEIDQYIESNKEYKKLENNIKELLHDNDFDWVFENYVAPLLIKLQDLSYQKGLQDGLEIKTILDNNTKNSLNL
jgi:hypothetical protein